MGWLAGIFVYALIWWIVLFAVLPWGVQVPDEPEPGHAAGAPSNPRLWQKVLATTLIALVVWLGVYFLMESGLISLRPE